MLKLRELRVCGPEPWSNAEQSAGEGADTQGFAAKAVQDPGFCRDGLSGESLATMLNPESLDFSLQ